MMPNSASDHDARISQQRAASNALQQPEEPETTLVARAEDVERDFNKSIGPDDWFPEYEAHHNQWVAGEPVAPAVAPAPSTVPEQSNEPEAIQEPVSEEQESEEQEQDDEPEASANASKHLSTMSFARTVSHEFNWNDDGNDDEDTEGGLPRTETDPFKFMPPTDRSNSFPAVPVLEHTQDHQLDHPLPSNQAEDIVNEVEHEVEQDEEREDIEAKLASAFQDSNDDDFLAELVEESGYAQYIGGDVQDTVEEASDARFTEGLPLIAHDADADANGTVDAAHQGHERLKTDFLAEEDDFFAQVRDSTADATQEVVPSPLERKSTMQVLDGMGITGPGANIATLQETPEEDEQVEDAEHAQDDAPEEKPAEDLADKWKEVFAGDDDDDFLLDDTTDTREVDPAAFFGSDDEGFLEDEAEQTSAQPAEPAPASLASPVTASPTKPLNGRYLPPGQTTSAAAPRPSPYLPSVSTIGMQPAASTPFLQSAPAPTPPMASGFGCGAPPPRPEPSKAQSFVDKAKGGYQSPYDLPMEVVKPKKRASMQNLQRTPMAPHVPPPPGPQAPPRSTSMYAQAPPARPVAGSVGSLSPPSSSKGTHPPTGFPKATPPKAKEAFFEDLPVVAKPRPASRHSVKIVPSPAQTSPYGPPLGGQISPQMPPPPSHISSYGPPAGVPPMASAPSQYLPTQPVQSPPQSIPGIQALVAPERVSPYAPLQSNSMPVPSIPPATSSRYSPAPPPSAPHLNGGAPPAAPSRYSPAPPSTRPTSSGYGTAPVGVAPPVLPHQPRTSSPLAHFEVSHDRSRVASANHIDPASGHFDRRTSSSYEQRLHRVPSLPPTREVEEEESSATTPAQGLSSPPPIIRQHNLTRQTPPPPASAFTQQSTLSPPKRITSNYSPTRSIQDFVPPQRSQTQSPGALYGNRAEQRVTDPIPRPSSVHGPTSPRTAAPVSGTFPPPQSTTSSSRPRGFSQNLNLIPPTDGRERDPLQRWKGVPVISWGVGGTLVTMFPRDVPRYGMGSSIPSVVRSPGEVKVRNVKDIMPLEEKLGKFPGPLRGKGKKKEVAGWLSAGIESLEAGLPRQMGYQQMTTSLEEKRAAERVLLWKILRLFVEHDGVLDGNPGVEQAVRDVLSPKAGEAGGPGSPLLMTKGLLPTSGAGFVPSHATTMNADAVDPSSIEELRNFLLEGDREKAVWAAADKRLWGHAMLIANTVSQDLYKKVTQEFVKKEVNYPGHNNESLAALYEVLSGNHEDCVDELVPVHARAGLQLMAKDSGIGATKDVTEGLDKWRETLTLILSNRSSEDTRAMNSLGNLLSSYGRAEAAHICFIFARSHSVFGGLDDPNSNFVLVGSDHRRQAEQFAKEAEPLLLSEVYEYGLSLAGGSNVPVSSPHLAAYKYQHALTLAEYGFRDKALQYCDAILNAVSSATRRSPYHHAILEAAVEDLSKRLKLAPKEESSSWIPKPSMNKVSDSVWNRFNKFVAGDDNEGSGQGSPTHGLENGPFARIAGGTPTISRPPSAGNLEPFAATVAGYPMANGPVAPILPAVPPTRAASRYAPGQPAAASPYEPSSAYAPRSSMERTSSELNRASFEMGRPSLDMQNSYGGANANAYIPPNSTSSPAQSFAPYNTTGLGLSSLSRESSYLPVSQSEQASQPPPLTSSSSGYEPLGKVGSAPNGSAYHPSVQDNPAPAESNNSPGYQPPSYGYEPPSFTPYEAPAEQQTGAESKEANGSAYEPPSYQPYGYEPPSYEPDSQPAQTDSDEETKPKPKRGIMYDDDDDLVVPKTREKTKEEKDRENAEMFRKVAEEEGEFLSFLPTHFPIPKDHVY